MMDGTATVMISRSDWKYLNFLGWTLFASILIITINQGSRKSTARDFVYFYSIGRILNEHPPEELYQYSLQKKVFDEVLPLKEGVYGPSPYPPFVAMFFRPFARLPYWTACRLWIGIALALYLAGLWLLTKHFADGNRLLQSLVFCFGLCLYPAISWSLLAGQVAVIGFFAMALAVCLEDSERQFLSGLALSICLYKPTLLVLVLPMLVVFRRFKTLAGFAVGATMVCALATGAAGPRIWLAYARMSADFAHIRLSLLLQDYLDIAAFSSMSAHGVPVIRAAVLSAGAVAAVYLFRAWWLARSVVQHRPATLIWATTITWTLLLNVYVPLYDSPLVVISIVASIHSLRSLPRSAFMICVLLLGFSYVSRSIAVATGVQVFSIILAALGILQLRLCPPTPSRGDDPSRPYCSSGSGRLIDCSEVLSV